MTSPAIPRFACSVIRTWPRFANVCSASDRDPEPRAHDSAAFTSGPRSAAVRVPAPSTEVPRPCSVSSQVLLHFSGLPPVPLRFVRLSNLQVSAAFLRQDPSAHGVAWAALGDRPRPAPCRARLPKAGGLVPRARGEASSCATCPTTVASVLVAFSYYQRFPLFFLTSATGFRHVPA